MYITINLINNKYYIGVHSTNKIEDNYLGSGKALKRSIKKHGREHFKKYIVRFFDNKQEMFEFESLVVDTNVIKDINSYNIVTGGSGGYRNISNHGKVQISLARKNKVVARDNNNNILCVSRDDFLNNNSLVGTTKGKVLMRDLDNNFLSVNNDDNRISSGVLIPATRGFVSAVDLVTNKKVMVSIEEFYSNSNLVGHTFGSKQTEESNLKRRLKLKGIPKPKRAIVECPVCGKTGDVANMKRWHFDNCKQYKATE